MTADLAGILPRLARAAIAQRLGVGPDAAPSAALPELDAPGAAFVTLTQGGRLRGCIGSLEAWRPLADDVASNAVAAALHDPRFPPLHADELARTNVEVSVLTPSEPIAFADEADLLSQLNPGLDGLVLEAGGRRGTFLPQVWDQLPDRRDFLRHLKRKAGLPETYWGEDVRVSRYRVTKYEE